MRLEERGWKYGERMGEEVAIVAANCHQLPLTPANSHKLLYFPKLPYGGPKWEVHPVVAPNY